MSMQAVLEQSVLYHADRVAIIDGERHVTYAELGERVNRLGRALLQLGLTSGDRVAILSLNAHQFSEWYLACATTGLVGVPLNVRFSPADLAGYLDYTGARALIVDGRLASLAAPILDAARTVEHVVGFGDDHDQPEDYETLLRSASPDRFPPSDPDAPVLIAPTSGTTGVIKGAVLSQRNTFVAGLSWLSGFPLRPESRHLVALPMFFASGAPGWYLSFFVGACNVLMPRFEPQQFLDLVDREEVSHTIVGPALLYQMMDAGLDLAPLRRLDVLGAGGAPLDPTRFAALHERVGPRLMIFFGLTEVAATATFLRPDDYLDGTGAVTDRCLSVGRPWPGVEIAVVDDDGTQVPHDGTTVGEVVVGGPTVGLGYWEMPEASAESFRDGRLLTGDLAAVDPDGFVYVVDRRKDIIVTGGINVGSLEVEAVIGQHPDVVAVAVIGVPHEQWGEAVHAVVVRAQDTSVDEQDIIAWCRERLASFKKPASVEFVDELPVSPTGKVLKRSLREPHWAGRARQV